MWRPRGGSRRLVVVDVRIVRAPETRDNKVPFSPLGNVETWLARNVYDDNNSIVIKNSPPFYTERCKTILRDNKIFDSGKFPKPLPPSVMYISKTYRK